MGEWDYINNKDGVNKVLKSRVDECAPFENVYTLQLLKYVLPLTASFFPEPMIKTGAFLFPIFTI